MYSNIQDFLDDWKMESQSTLNVFSRIDDQKKSTKINENLRSLERLAWHITQTLTEMLFRAGIFDEDQLENAPVPDTMKKNMEIYTRYSKELAELVREKWEKVDLMEKINMYGEMWERRNVLSAFIKHEIHHRGQMTAIMRMLDMEVPGIYGPAKEEWSKFGMDPQD
jgi:uncharacterized damage-inducible protein DinB